MAEPAPDPLVELGDAREEVRPEPYAEFAKLVREGRAGALVTVTGSTGSVPRGLGAAMTVREDGSIAGTIGGGAVEYDAIARAREAMADGRPRRLRYDFTSGPGRNLEMSCAGTMELLVQPCRGGPALLVFGAGHVSRALAPMAQAAGYRVTVLDDRDGYPRPADYPGGVTLRPGAYERTTRDEEFDAERTYVVVVTHGHERDRAVLRLCLPRPWRYLGMIGSRAKVAQAYSALRGEGAAPERLGEVRAPIGLDLGGRSPGEIAVSILAECQAVRNGRVTIRPMSAGGKPQGERDGLGS